MNLTIGLIPLDERPVNTRYPAMIAAIAGARLFLPPAEALSALRYPADCAAIIGWLEQVTPQLDALIVSCEMLGYGGLIASRTGTEPVAAVLARLDALRAVRRIRPELPIYGFSLVTRVSNADDAIEEPDYWARYGTRLYQLSHLLDRKQQGQPVDPALAAAAAGVPSEHQHDFLRRRLRNHAVNSAVLHMLAEGIFDLLVLSSDDTSPFGLPSREKRWLAGWADLLALGERLLMYPGADEVGCVLVARLLNRQAGVTPRFLPIYAPPEGAEQVAAYEDGPIRLTIERQVQAVGGQIASDETAILLGVAAPVERRSEWSPGFAHQERTERQPALEALVSEVQRCLQLGRPVALADVVYPNGADPVLIELLRQHLDLSKLVAYAAWNTAGNTVGTVLAQACAVQFADTPAQRAAQERFLVHRFLEDWGYQQVVRAGLRHWLRTSFNSSEPSTENLAATCDWIERQLDELINQLPGFAGRYRVVPGSVRLPWGRTFEVDFELIFHHEGYEACPELAEGITKTTHPEANIPPSTGSPSTGSRIGTGQDS